jgi:hypothetical protein
MQHFQIGHTSQGISSSLVQNTLPFSALHPLHASPR